jgi:hypothetical protein
MAVCEASDAGVRPEAAILKKRRRSCRGCANIRLCLCMKRGRRAATPSRRGAIGVDYAFKLSSLPSRLYADAAARATTNGRRTGEHRRRKDHGAATAVNMLCGRRSAEGKHDGHKAADHAFRITRA